MRRASGVLLLGAALFVLAMPPAGEASAPGNTQRARFTMRISGSQIVAWTLHDADSWFCGEGYGQDYPLAFDAIGRHETRFATSRPVRVTVSRAGPVVFFVVNRDDLNKLFAIPAPATYTRSAKYSELIPSIPCAAQDQRLIDQTRQRHSAQIQRSDCGTRNNKSYSVYVEYLSSEYKIELMVPSAARRPAYQHCTFPVNADPQELARITAPLTPAELFGKARTLTIEAGQKNPIAGATWSVNWLKKSYTWATSWKITLTRAK